MTPELIVTGEAAEHRLPEHANQRMAAILALVYVCEILASHRAQPDCVVELEVSQQSRIGRDHGPAELQHQPAVEVEFENPVS